MSAVQGAGRGESMKDDDDEQIVHVEGVEKGIEEDTGNTWEKVGKKEKEPEGHFHEGETIKTTYTVEEDTPSLYQKLKGKFIAVEYQVKHMVGDYTKKANPPPEKNISVSTEKATHQPHIVSQIKKAVWGDKHDPKDKVKEKKYKEEEVEGKGDVDDETMSPGRLERFSSTKETFDSETTEDKKVQAGDELGTGYEEDGEGGASPEINTSAGGVTLPNQAESIFKPAKSKDDSEVTLEELRSSKLNQNSSAEDVKAPGVFARLKEEVDAIADQVSEDVGLKGK